MHYTNDAKFSSGMNMVLKVRIGRMEAFDLVLESLRLFILSFQTSLGHKKG